MPSVTEPFDGVLTEKEWSKARDKTGLTGSLTEKVSMGKELTLFHKTKDEAAANHLLSKIAIYEQALKTKHSKDKYYAKLLALVNELQKALHTGLNILKSGPVIADLRKRLKKLTLGWGDLVKEHSQSGASEKAFKERLAAIKVRVTALLEEVPEGAHLLNPTTVEKVVHVEKDWEQFKADLEKEATDDDDDEEGNEGRATTTAGKYWEKTMVPYLTGQINAVLSKHPDLILKGQPAQVIAGLLGGVRQTFERTFEFSKIKPLGDHGPDPQDATSTEAATSARALLLQAAQTAVNKKADTQWFQYAPIPEKTKTGGGEKKIAFTGTAPEEFDDKKAYGSLLVRLSSLKADPGAAANFLRNAKQLTAIFPYEMSNGIKTANPQNEPPSVVKILSSLGELLSNGVDSARRSLREQPPGIEAARTRLGQLEQAVNGLTLPRHGDTVQKGVKLFILKPLEDEINAAQKK